MLLLAEGLFRLDVAISGDTLRTYVRNLSSGPLQMRGGADESQGGHLGDVVERPTQAIVRHA